MQTDELERLLAPVSPETPGGDNLEYDPAFVALENIARGKAEQRMGDAVVAGEGPNWREVQRAALDLLGRTKDLRVAVYLTRAWAWSNGLSGLRDGLTLVRGLLERHWDTLHPLLDPDDDFDPTVRLNALAALADADATLRGVREAPLVEARGVGRFSLRDVQLAAGSAGGGEEGRSGPDQATLDAAFSRCDVEALAATAAAATEAAGHLDAIKQILSERAGTGDTLSELAKVVRAARQLLNDRLAARGGAPGEASEASTEEPMDTPRPSSGAVRVGDISTRDDAVRALERLCEYFERNEPSSPVPLLLRRAKRLVSKSFLDIIRDLAPDGVAQVEALKGIDTETE